MTNELAVIETTGTLVSVVDQTILAAFGIDDARLAEIKAECESLSFETPKEYDASAKVHAKVRTTRTGIEKRRVELVATPLEEQRKINLAAKLITAALEEIETPIAERRKLVDDAKKAEKAAREAAVRAAEEARIRAANEAREAELRSEIEAKEKALAEAQAKIDAANAELAAKQEAFAKERARITDLQEAETQRIAAETRRIAEEKRQAELAEARRLADIESERVARENAERERVAAEERRVAELERVATLKAREEALKPDKMRISNFGKRLVALVDERPELADVELDAGFMIAIRMVNNAIDHIEGMSK